MRDEDRQGLPGDGAGAEPPDAAAALAALLSRAAAGHGRLPPVERWNPAHCGTIDIRIDRDGGWHYLGTPIRRAPLVRLFSTVLRREPDGSYVLVTPGEKLTIRVEDVPFLAVEMIAEGEGPARRLTFRTNLGDIAVADADHPLRFPDAADGGFMPYLTVRGGLEARLTRALAVDLAAFVEEDAAGRAGVWSGGVLHALPDGAGAALHSA